MNTKTRCICLLVLATLCFLLSISVFTGEMRELAVAEKTVFALGFIGCLGFSAKTIHLALGGAHE